MRLTMPQIYMLNHAAAVNKKRLDAKIKWQRDHDKFDTVNDAASAGLPMFNGKSVDQLTSDEYQSYLAM